MRVSIPLDELFKEVASDCDLDSYTVRYCIQRLRKEGIKFWTVTLPKLAKYVLYSIEEGSLIQDPKVKPTDFAWQGRSLRYFRSLLGKIFCLKTGDILDNPSADALCNLRQICEYVYKLSLEFDASKLKEYRVKYETVQSEVANAKFSADWVERLRKNAETFYPTLFKAQPHDILRCGPRFGPGSFAGSDKVPYAFCIWKQLPDSIIGTFDESMRAHAGYFKPYPGLKRHVRTDAGIQPAYKYNAVRSSRIAEVLFVPKDSRGPRVISKEPLHILKPQMAYFEYVSSALENDTRRRINFESQGINRNLARLGSVDRGNATLDLKDASDRVSFSLVRRIFRNASGIRFFLQHCRSNTYQLPAIRSATGKLLSDKKLGTMHALAGMGSGLTFPTMAFLIHLSICTMVSTTLRLNYKSVASRVYVYGDDVVVPIEWVTLAKAGLEKSGLMLNTSKCYAKGPFRESCGGDYLNGKEVMPIRLKCANAGLSTLSQSSSGAPVIDTRNCKQPSSLVVSLVKHAQELRLNGRFKTAAYLEKKLSRAIPMPLVGKGSAILGVITESEVDIAKQGKLDTTKGYNTMKCVVSSPVIVRSDQVCPYKYLSSVLKNTYDNVFGPLGSVRATVYGAISVPRRIKLRTVTRSVSEALPAREYQFCS
jgi:hypothetical protein